MRNTLIVALVALLAGLAFVPQAQADSDRRWIHLRGVIAEVGDAGIVLEVHNRDGDTRLVPIHVNRHTGIFINRHRVHLADLEVGDHARVLARRTDAGLFARIIAVQRDRG